MTGNRATTSAASIALVIITLVPSSATSAYGLGGLAPVVAALAIQILGLMIGYRALRRPPGFLWAFLGFSLIGVGTGDVFVILLPVVGLLQYLLVWSSPATGRRAVRNLIIWLATIEGVLAIFEATVLSGPIVGTARTIDAYNPFMPSLLRAQGTLGHPLVLALFLLVGLTLILAARDIRARFRVPVAMILAAGSVFTGSSTTVVLGAVVIVAFLLLRTKVVVALYTSLWLLIVALWQIASNNVPTFLLADINERTTQHRLNSIESLPRLFDSRPTPEVLFGSGSLDDLYSRGVLINDGFFAVDNQFVTTVALTGLLGSIATVIFTLAVARNTRKKLHFVSYIVFLVSAFSFDFMLWYVGIMLFFSVAGISQDDPRPKKAEDRQLSRTQSADDAFPTAL